MSYNKAQLASQLPEEDEQHHFHRENNSVIGVSFSMFHDITLGQLTNTCYKIPGFKSPLRS